MADRIPVGKENTPARIRQLSREIAEAVASLPPNSSTVIVENRIFLTLLTSPRTKELFTDD
jgi:hypothetical protein